MVAWAFFGSKRGKNGENMEKRGKNGIKTRLRFPPVFTPFFLRFSSPRKNGEKTGEKRGGMCWHERFFGVGMWHADLGMGPTPFSTINM